MQGGDRFAHVEARIRDELSDSHVRELITGHAGCGKSTELLRLAASLRREQAGRAYHVVYLDAYEYLNQFEIRLPQILVSLLAALAQEPRIDLKRTRSGPAMWTRVQKILKSLGKEVSSDFAAATGIPLLRSLFRVDLKLTRDFRKQSDDYLEELLELTLPIVGEMPFTRDTVKRAAADYVNEYERILQGKPYLGLLHTIERDGAFPVDTNEAWKQLLLLGLIALAYDTGTWYDIHPLVKATRAFRLAAPAHP